jgi:hypothetical protein
MFNYIYLKETVTFTLEEVFYNIASYSLVEIHRRFRNAYCLYHQLVEIDGRFAGAYFFHYQGQDGGSTHL